MIDLFWFTVSLCIGLLYVYLTSEDKEEVIRYPTPDNAGNITYVDDAGVCYKYKVVPRSCPSNPDKIKVMTLTQN